MGRFKKDFKNLTIFKKTKTILRTLLVLLLLIIVLVGIYVLSIIAIRETVKTLDYFVQEEQKRDLSRFEEKLIIASKHLDKLEEELEKIKDKKYYYLTVQEKEEMLEIIWELRKDSWRIESAWLNHQNDLSITFYPRKNEQIEEKFKNYWQSHILLDRLVSDTERIVYSVRVDRFQLNQLKNDLSVAREIIKKTSIEAKRD